MCNVLFHVIKIVLHMSPLLSLVHVSSYPLHVRNTIGFQQMLCSFTCSASKCLMIYIYMPLQSAIASVIGLTVGKLNITKR